MFAIDAAFFIRQVLEASAVAFIESNSGKLITTPKLICKNYFR